MATVASLDHCAPLDLAAASGRGKEPGRPAWRSSGPRSPLAEAGRGTGRGRAPACEAEGDVAGAEAARKAAQDALETIQHWLADESKADSRLALITAGRDGHRARASHPTRPPAAIWGLVRSAQSEHPGRFALIDSDGSEASERALPAALALGGGGAPARPARGQGRWRRASPARSGEARTETRAAIDPERTVLITGATGGLGALSPATWSSATAPATCSWSAAAAPRRRARRSCRRSSRSWAPRRRSPPATSPTARRSEKLLASIPAEHPLGAVVHSAGALADGTVESLGAEQLERVFAPKADAAWHLHELTADLDLSAFVLFSSAAGTLGGPGQANYAAANVFLDALAQRRRAEGLRRDLDRLGPLGARERHDSRASSEADLARMRRGGVEALSDERGLALFDAALGAGRATALAVPLDTAGLRAMASAGALPPIFSGLVRVPQRRSAASGSLAAKLATLPEAEREGYVLDLVRGEVAAVLGHASAAEVEPDKAFQELGFDSLAAVELRNRLGAVAGLRLPATVVFDYPSAAALAEHLLAEATASGGGKAGRGPRPGERGADRDRRHGLPLPRRGQLARGALAAGRRGPRRRSPSSPPTAAGTSSASTTPTPSTPAPATPARAASSPTPASSTPSSSASAPREALAMDPQQRLLLESCWEALEDAGIDPASLRKTPDRRLRRGDVPGLRAGGRG